MTDEKAKERLSSIEKVIRDYHEGINCAHGTCFLVGKIIGVITYPQKAPEEHGDVLSEPL